MLTNFLVISLRNFLRNKSYTLINIAGLTLGLASATLIFLFIHEELTYDSVHPDYKRIYSVGLMVTDKNGNKNGFGGAPAGWAERLKEKFPNIDAVAKLAIFGFPASIHNKEADRIVLNQDGEMYWADPSFQQVFYLPMMEGTSERTIALANSMVISSSAAKALFGDEDPINKTLSIKHIFATFGKEVVYVVTGVFQDPSANTFFRPKYVLNINGLRTAYSEAKQDFDRTVLGNDLRAIFMNTYFRMKANSNMNGIDHELGRLCDFATKSDSGFYASGRRLSPILKTLPETHFDLAVSWIFPSDAISRKILMSLGAIAVLILVIASINYMNLATARSARRAREVGVRKTLGSSRGELALQFIFESALTTGISLVLAFILIILSLPAFNQLTHKSFTIFSLFQPVMLCAMLGLTVFVTLLGGSYPAFFLSSFRPIDVLKGTISGWRGDTLRKSLVTFQFAAAILLVIGTNTVVSQMNLMQRSKLNESGDQLLSIRYGSVAPNEKWPAFKNAVSRDKDLEFVTMGNHLPRLDYFGDSEFDFKIPQLSDKQFTWNQLNVDFDFPKTYALQFAAGRDFDSNIVSDSNSCLINERAAADLHKENKELLGMAIERVHIKNSAKIIGVVKDFPFQSAYHAIGPLVISARPDPDDRIVYIKVPHGKFKDKIKSIEQTWKAIIPGVGFDYWFVSDEFNRMYKEERKTSALARIFAVLGMAITILGLYGLAAYMAEQKTKEIGIRKTMGASVAQVALLFISIFLKIFIIGAMVAIPTAYYFTNDWLKSFSYRITPGPLIFIASAGGVLLLMLLTVLHETVKAARSNPVKALKHE